MNLRIVFSRVAALFRARSLDHDLDEELRAHLDLLIEENTARGMYRDEARRAALRRLGNLDHLKESYRDERGLPWIETVARDYSGSAALLARTAGDPESAIRAIREEIRQLDSGLPLYDAKTMREHLRLSLFPLRAGAWVAGSFALLAAILSALGIYGVMAYAVSQRTREFGIRMALGARPGDVTSLVVKQGMKLAAIGLALGWIGALALSRLLSRVLAAARTTDWETFAAVTLLLAAAVWLACWFPARRATRVDPLESLRYE